MKNMTRHAMGQFFRKTDIKPFSARAETGSMSYLVRLRLPLNEVTTKFAENFYKADTDENRDLNGVQVTFMTYNPNHEAKNKRFEVHVRWSELEKDCCRE